MSGLQPRRPNGRFAETGHTERPVDLGTEPVGGTSSAALLRASVAELDDLVDSPDAADQIVAARALALTAEQASRLAELSRPFAVRFAIAGRPGPGHAERAAADPDPVIRARAFEAGVGLSAEIRRRLETDPHVQRALSVLGRTY